MPRIVSVNVGTPRQISVRRGRPMMSAIVKEPVEGPVRVEGVNLAGDDQADRRVHGGPDKAVYAYAREDIDWWQDVRGDDLADGVFGENLTTEGIDVSGAIIGERWQVGSTVLEVCQPRLPCSKLGLRFGDLRMVKAFAQASRPGAYLRIITEGELQAGDAIEVIQRPEHGVTLAMSRRRRAQGPVAGGQGADRAQLSDELRQELAEQARLGGGLRRGHGELVGAVVERLVGVRGARLVAAHPVPAHGAEPVDLGLQSAPAGPGS